MAVLRALIMIILVSVVVWGVLQGIILKRQLLLLGESERLAKEQVVQQGKINDLLKRYDIK